MARPSWEERDGWTMEAELSEHREGKAHRTARVRVYVADDGTYKAGGGGARRRGLAPRVTRRLAQARYGDEV